MTDKNLTIHWSKIVEQSPFSTWIADKEGTAIWQNQSCKDLFGISGDEEVIGKYNLFKDNLIAEQGFMPLVKAVFEKGEIAHFIIDYPFNLVSHVSVPEGKHVNLEVTVFPLKDDSGQIINAIVQHKDITKEGVLKVKLEEKEEQLELAMKGSNDGLWDWDMRTNKVYYSEKWKSMIGYNDDEIKNEFSEWERLIHPDDRKKTLNYVKEYSESGGAYKFEMEFMMIHKDGHFVNILARAFMQKDESGKPIRMVGTHIDISDRKRFEKELKESEDRYKKLFESMKSGVAIYEVQNEGKTFLFKSLNAAGEKINNIKSEKLVGKDLLEVFPGAKEMGLLEVLERVYKTGKPESFPLKEYKDDRVKGWRENYIYKISENEVVAIHDDLTEEKQQAYVIEQAKEELEVRNEKLEKFNELTTDRELKMVELKKEIIELKSKLNEK